VENLLTSAMEMHQAGQLGSAAQLYQEVLAKQQDNADALHLLGVLHFQQGQPQRAVELIGRAVAQRPSFAPFHINLAEAYRVMGQLKQAAGCCHTALRLWPDNPVALCNLGLVLHGQRQHAAAAEQFRRALQVQPDLALAHNNLGLVLRELGRLDEALAHFRKAVAIDRTFAEARSNLGQLLVDQGHAEEALPHCQEAVRLQPNLAALHHNLGNAMQALGRLVEARVAYLEALRLDPNLARSHAHLGLILQREGQLGDALPWLKQATELEPGNALFWQHLADLHGDREAFAEAIRCWERVLALGPERAEVHNALGWSLQEEGRLAEAREHYHLAQKLEPDSAAAQVNLGGLHEELGELAEAEDAFRTAARMEPGHPLPHARLAVLLRGKLADSDRAALEQLVTDPRPADAARAHLLFGLAQVLDGRGEYSRAAHLLRQANALTLGHARSRGRAYAPAEHERFIDGVLAVFGQEFMARTAGGGLATRRPVFVFGLPRSGTTLIEQVLASHARPRCRRAAARTSIV
jgi:tetratricopeptide (TPR) repeat protein